MNRKLCFDQSLIIGAKEVEMHLAGFVFIIAFDSHGSNETVWFI